MATRTTTIATALPPAEEIELSAIRAVGKRDSDSVSRISVSAMEAPPGGEADSKRSKARLYLQLATLYWTMFLLGWNDGTQGPLLPRIQSDYRVGFIPVSLLFVFQCLGSFIGAMMNVTLAHRIGFGKMMAAASLAQLLAYSLQAAMVPFPAFIFAACVNGIGMAIQDGQANGFVASLENNSIMGYLHAAYGAGAFAAPLVATQFSQLPRWSLFYLISLGISVANTLLLSYTFRFKSLESCLADVGRESGEQDTTETAHFKQIMKNKTVHLLGIFILLYVGVEVTLGGWIVTFMIDVRGGGSSAGYVSSGFWGGLMVGRVILLWLNKKLGEYRALLLYSFVAIGLQLVVWLVPSLIAGAVAVSFIGVLLGPTYPLAMNHAGRVLPRWILTGSIGWIGAVGTAGAAFFPFLTGILASKEGIKVLQPLVVGMISAMAIVWAIIPRGRQRPE
ncbi:MFS general substrate transporter [Coniophora puteana RWD-64-598 SS2]|uniref:MFS general substrate transporter n=1 Tax=Coniophora puteana (strain RWD-64-598) TaxID=741705 RepID=A0A5M3MUE7_CONPW|nr:MFS general substrate transporter [Coniophora puteana RWD-64-598 SS2]EIW82726.1 MFS general substrate transporter [Coniophora puteana RWD-64-598 SS2]